jgi:hypothetical protein
MIIDTEVSDDVPRGAIQTIQPKLSRLELEPYMAR